MKPEEKEEVLDALVGEKKIELGDCPYCGSNNYSRDTSDYQDDYVVMNCYCEDCKNTFTEYFSLDEVRFSDLAMGDSEEENVYYTKNLSEEDKETIIDWAEQELEMKEEQFTNKDHHDDYKARVRRIIKVMKGECYKEYC